MWCHLQNDMEPIVWQHMTDGPDVLTNQSLSKRNDRVRHGGKERQRFRGKESKNLRGRQIGEGRRNEEKQNLKGTEGLWHFFLSEGMQRTEHWDMWKSADLHPPQPVYFYWKRYQKGARGKTEEQEEKNKDRHGKNSKLNTKKGDRTEHEVNQTVYTRI